jgi:trans-2,3-dihydro-3-hydroxyanthranilate isomerase
VGLPFLVVELATRGALRRARPNLAAFAGVLPLDGADAIYAYTRDIDRDGPEADSDLQARMFCPLDGIVEDPATGSATAATAALLAESRQAGDLTLRVGQGVDMGRPSLLRARVERGKDGRGPMTHVGGHCVAVLERTFRLDGAECAS